MKLINALIHKIALWVLIKSVGFEKRKYKQYKEDKTNLFIVTLQHVVQWLFKKNDINSIPIILCVGSANDNIKINCAGNTTLSKKDHIFMLLRGIYYWIKVDWHEKDETIKGTAIKMMKEFIENIEHEDITDQS